MKRFSYSSTIIIFSILLLVLLISFSNSSNRNAAVEGTEIIVQVNPDYFIQEGLLEPIIKVDHKLSDGSTAECYKIVTKSIPSEHAMGPWCPTNINDSADKGGIWMESGKVYDVDGAFVANLAKFYNDSKWKLYNADGSINVTDTKEACEAAARPDVDPAYQNFCVQCLPSYSDELKQIFYIPVRPIVANKTIANKNILAGPPPRGGGNRPPDGEKNGGRPDGGRPPQGLGEFTIGIAFNGVNFDPPAPTADILKHYTLAPLDDNGGHINLHAGYHYHAATGKTKK
ncbi:hypothetical protein ADIARSV_0932 [Arcticibacter svalbardensis MN12-7]|uniref:YHYH domain-containing protein n=1 Tax=Arcticibacter svalbardensis MN12-7 TaxID=1150600 RepID=R9GWG2_9SPHI|nr:hypothetical protein [Arcticibacter svalbardensis]EOR95870.1 hypothetical protein ADIARSV_0932 [Arcticibacter svalbardensis MN12-7]